MFVWSATIMGPVCSSYLKTAPRRAICPIAPGSNPAFPVLATPLTFAGRIAILWWRFLLGNHLPGRLPVQAAESCFQDEDLPSQH